MKEYLLRLKHAKATLKPNLIKIPITSFHLNETSIEAFNRIYQWLYNSNYERLSRTRSGGISIKKINMPLPAWDIKTGKTWIDIVYIDLDGSWRIQFRFEKEETDPAKKQQYGTQSFREFKKKCLEYGIDLDTYTIDNGVEVKKEIDKYLIQLENHKYKDLVFDNAHHIDFHNSFPAGLVNTHPEFKEVITELYEKRKQNEIYKAILNHSIGYFQSIDCCGARWAHLAKDAIHNNNTRVLELAQKLRDSGRMVISFNTDGIWYAGDIYHGEGEGKRLGEWENDHTNCRFRAKSKGAYEYIENGVYTPVVRGQTRLDRVKPRDEWEWGDIYKREAIVEEYLWIEGKGIIKKEGEEIYDELTI